MVRAFDALVGADAYVRIALADDDRHWELWDGVLVEKPGMSTEHNHAVFELGSQLRSQVDPGQFRVRVNRTRLRKPTSYFTPDVLVVPTAMERLTRGRPGRLETYADAIPFVAEICSPSTGGYDIDAKVPEYKTRGDLEIWRLHPFERRLTAWRREPNGEYLETTRRDGRVPVESLPGVAVDLDALFEE